MTLKTLTIRGKALTAQLQPVLPERLPKPIPLAPPLSDAQST